jgi:hypothetical protein
MSRLEYLKAVVCSLKSEAEIDEILTKWKVKDSDGWCEYDTEVKFINDTFKEVGITDKNADNFWGTRYIIAADYLRITDNIVVTGTDQGEIGWTKAITREEAAHIMYNACKKVNGESLIETKGIQNIIPDFNEINNMMATSVQKLVSNGLIAGVDDNYTFAPKQTLTRAQACCIIARITDTSRRLDKPVVPEDKQQYINIDVERDITYHNPVTGKDETKDINEWRRTLTKPSYDGTTDGEISSDGYYEWTSGLGRWIRLVEF